MKKKIKKENFFVGINNPVVIRRNLLSASKELIDSLKKYERYELIRNTKHEYVVELKKILDEAVVLNKKLRSHLPKNSAEEAPKLKPAKIAHKKAKETGSSQAKVDILEQELSKIEGKLDALE